MFSLNLQLGPSLQSEPNELTAPEKDPNSLSTCLQFRLPSDFTRAACAVSKVVFYIICKTNQGGGRRVRGEFEESV